MDENMAWPKEVERVVNLLEDSIYVQIEITGYLKALATQGNTVAGVYAGRLEGLTELYRLIRQQHYQQLGLWPAGPEEDGDQDFVG